MKKSLQDQWMRLKLMVEFFDFEGKYEMKGAAIHCPARIDEKTFQRSTRH